MGRGVGVLALFILLRGSDSSLLKWLQIQGAATAGAGGGPWTAGGALKPDGNCGCCAGCAGSAGAAVVSDRASRALSV